MHIVREPETEEAFAFLRTELLALRNRKGHMLQILGGCVVDYAGRAASTLDQGERLVLLKPDGTLLVHTATKSKPVNWMPPGANEMGVTMEDDRVVLTVVRSKPHKEVVKIRFLDIRLLLAVPLRDSEELVLRRTEGDLHRLFFENPALIEEGLVVYRGEKATRRGPLDLWGVDRNGHRVIVEVKRSKAGIAEATQLWRYVEMERNGRFDGEKNGHAAVNGNGDGEAHGNETGNDEAHGNGKGNGKGKATGKATGKRKTKGDDKGDDVVTAAPDTPTNGPAPKVRGILVCPGISSKAAQMLADHGLEHKDIDWDDLLAHLEAPRAAGQSTLSLFAGGSAQPLVEKTVRTGKKRHG
jgi:endonuclease